MLNKTIKQLIIALILTAALATGAFADFDAMYMTNANGSYTPQTIFDLTETPWLYLKLPGSGLNQTTEFWADPSEMYYLTYNMGNANEYWLSLDSGVDMNGDPVSWADVKTIGEWNINANYSYSGGGEGQGITSFTVISHDAPPVAPEPISSLLFMAGGAVLAGRRYINKKRNGSNKIK